MTQLAALTENDQLPRLWRHLLGEPSDSIPTIGAWPTRAQRSSGRDAQLELACAHLYNSQLHEAKRHFQEYCAGEDDKWRCLAEVGLGKVFNLLAQFQAADACFRRAADQGERETETALTLVTCFRLLNQSDAGSRVDEALLARLRTSSFTGRLESVRRHTLARLFFRDGERFEAIALLEEFLDTQEARSLPIIHQAHLTRMHAILLGVCGKAAAGRASHLESLDSFQKLGYVRGSVRCLLSLVRAYAPLDLVQAQAYLLQARELLSETSPPRAPIEPGRKAMPMEWAELYAREGDVAFLRGEFQKAERCFRLDADVLEFLQTGSPESLKRETAHALRNLGKAQVQTGATKEAVRSLSRSAELFGAAGDLFNAFNSSAAECDAAIRAEQYERARSVADKLARGLFSGRGRTKEQAIIQVLQAAIAWLAERRRAKALHLIDQAKAELGVAKDYFYCKALVVKARILVDSHDERAAQQELLEAWRHSSSAEMADVQREAEALLESIGVRRHAITSFDRTNLELECESRGYVDANLTILYADIRGFTHACTEIEPNQMAAFIGEFSRIVSSCAARKGGLPIRFLGDCVMALFGVRNNQTDVVQSALEAACEMHELFCRLRDRWSSHTESLGGIGLGCGIATGSVVAGRFGAAGLSEFSVIGEPANLASRIQGLAEDGQVAMCSSTRLVLRNSLVGLEEHDRQFEKELKGLGKRTIFVLDMPKARRLLRPSIRPPSPTTQNEPETLRQVPTTVTQSTGGEVIPIGFPASGDLRDVPRSDLDILAAFDGDAKDGSA